MKKVIVLLSALFLMTITAQTVNAQISDDATAKSSAYIVVPIAITKSVDLDFGKIVKTVAGGTATINPATQARTLSGVGEFLNDQTYTTAEFAVTGEANADFSVVLTTQTITLTHTTTAGATMSLALTASPSNTSTATMSATGTATVYVGGTLTIGASQATGLYENASDLEVTVAYN